MLLMESDKKPVKVSIFHRIKAKYLGIRTDFVKKKNKFFLSDDWKAIKTLVGEVTLYGLLLLGGYLGFVSSNLLIKLFGLGMGFWIFKEKIVPIITAILGSISIVRNYR
jgi:hypothetical protein